MTTSALPSEVDDDAHSHSGAHQLHKEHSGDLEAHFLHVRHPCPHHLSHRVDGVCHSSHVHIARPSPAAMGQELARRRSKPDRLRLEEMSRA